MPPASTSCACRRTIRPAKVEGAFSAAGRTRTSGSLSDRVAPPACNISPARRCNSYVPPCHFVSFHVYLGVSLRNLCSPPRHLVSSRFYFGRSPCNLRSPPCHFVSFYFDSRGSPCNSCSPPFSPWCDRFNSACIHVALSGSNQPWSAAPCLTLPEPRGYT